MVQPLKREGSWLRASHQMEMKLQSPQADGAGSSLSCRGPRGLICAQSLGLMARELACKVIPTGLIFLSPASPWTIKTAKWFLHFFKMREPCYKERLLLNSAAWRQNKEKKCHNI